jgi:hypothetical protein
MNAPANDVSELMCVPSGATFCTVRRREGEPAHLVIIAEDEGVAIVQRHGSEDWVQVYLGDLHILDTAYLDFVVAAVIERAFGPVGGAR